MQKAVLATSEVIPSRAVRALEGEGRRLSHLEVAARGRLWRQLASRGIDQGAQRVKTNHSALILSLCSSCNYRPRCCQSWTPIPTPIQATPHSTQSSGGLVKSLPFPTTTRCTLVRCTPVRYTPKRHTSIRYTPVRYTPMRHPPIRCTLAGCTPVRHEINHKHPHMGG